MNINLVTSFQKKINVEIRIPDDDDDFIDIYKMYIYDLNNGIILSAINKDDKIIIDSKLIELDIANSLFNEFKAHVRNVKINKLI